MEYGKSVHGCLIIQTDDVMWSYDVRGSIPQYEPPTAVASKISTRLSKEVEQQMRLSKLNRGKNFIKSNLESTAMSRQVSVKRSPAVALSRQASIKRSDSSVKK